MIRYHSFYAAHREGAYTHLMNDHDRRRMEWVRAFNPYDLYSKGHEPPDVDGAAALLRRPDRRVLPGRAGAGEARPVWRSIGAVSGCPFPSRPLLGAGSAERASGSPVGNRVECGVSPDANAGRTTHVVEIEQHREDERRPEVTLDPQDREQDREQEHPVEAAAEVIDPIRRRRPAWHRMRRSVIGECVSMAHWTRPIRVILTADLVDRRRGLPAGPR